LEVTTIVRSIPASWTPFFLLLLALPAAAAATAATAAVAAAESAFGERIDVRAVNVEAVVTDRSGHRVSGLTAADFRLQVDGRDVAIDYFAEITEGRKTGGEPAPPAGATPAVATSPGAGSAAVGTSYLVFIDDSFSFAIQRNTVLDHLRADLALLGPGDRMAIVAWNGRKLVPLSSWSADATTLAAALVKAAGLPTLGIHARDERRTWSNDQALGASAQSDITTSRGPDAADSEVSDLKARGDALNGSTGLVRRAGPGRCVDEFPISPIQCVELQEAIGAAAAALRGLPDPGGRKVALLLSGGWPYGAGPHLFKPLLDTADQLGYTLYPVDVPGIDSGAGVVDATLTGPAASTGLISGSWERESKDALEYLAASTGGKAFLNSARLDALKRTVADTRSYYALGFSPVWRADDKGHKVKVSLKRAGLTVRSRSGFTDLAPRTESAMRAESALLLGGAAEDRRLRLEIGPPQRRFGTIEVAVTLAVPVSALTLTPQGQGYLAEANLSFAVQDEAGGRSSVSDIPLRLKLPKAPVSGSYARYRTKVKLRRTGQTLVALLRDRESGATLWDEMAVGQ
jgi:VWFA-related protein